MTCRWCGAPTPPDAPPFFSPYLNREACRECCGPVYHPADVPWRVRFHRSGQRTRSYGGEPKTEHDWTTMHGPREEVEARCRAVCETGRDPQAPGITWAPHPTGYELERIGPR